jgi:hypothetical protein
MAPFEMLYSRRCRTPLFWNETEERKVFRLDILQKLRSKFIWLGRTCELLSQGKRATSVIEEES